MARAAGPRSTGTPTERFEHAHGLIVLLALLVLVLSMFVLWTS